jgi:hypothetical protein
MQDVITLPVLICTLIVTDCVNAARHYDPIKNHKSNVVRFVTSSASRFATSDFNGLKTMLPTA